MKNAEIATLLLLVIDSKERAEHNDSLHEAYSLGKIEGKLVKMFTEEKLTNKEPK
jgi:hypothetical protein